MRGHRRNRREQQRLSETPAAAPNDQSLDNAGTAPFADAVADINGAPDTHLPCHTETLISAATIR